MAVTPDDPLAAGSRALAQGDWPGARDAFRSVLETGEAPEALVGLSAALWWLGDALESISHRERAFAAFSARGDARPAASAAWQLSLDHWEILGNSAAGWGWLARARRLVDDHGLEPARGWVWLLEARYTSDSGESEQLASSALERARATGDTALQLCALSQLGAALVEQGRVVDGLRMLDEAMAGSLAGEGGRPDPAAFTSCTTLQACTSCADFARAVQWLRATDRFMQRFGSPYVRADCRIHYATVLVAMGDWTQAEEELSTALTLASGTLPALHGDALVALAALRLAQGRTDEAARLVDGLEGRPGAAAVIGGVYLRQGRPESARSVLQRGLATLGADRLQAVAVRELLGQALVACGDAAAARAHGEALVEIGAARGCRVATAYGARLRGYAATAAAEPAAARSDLDTALATFLELEMPLEAARTRLLLAGHLRDRAPQAAVDESRAALSALDGLGARREADAAAALLRELGVTVSRGGTRTTGELTSREQEVLALLGEGLSNPEIAERLYVSRKTVERHVARVLARLGLRSRAEAAAEAVRGGYVAGPLAG